MVKRQAADYFSPVTWPFWAVHVVAVAGVFGMGWSWTGFGLAVGLYSFRMFLVTGVLHRYLSHRSYKTSRWFQFLLTLLATTSAQKGALWWAANHRQHHKHSDQPEDLHSPRQHGFWWSHLGWITCRDHEHTQWERIPDLACYPELRFLNRFHLIPPVLLSVGLWLLGGWHALLWGFFVSTTLLWHGTFFINSLAHVIGRRRYHTKDDSKNSLVLALITLGEGWHNNHHYYQRSVNQGFRWYEIDITYYVLKFLALFGLVWGLHRAPSHVVEGTRKRSPELSSGKLITPRA